MRLVRIGHRVFNMDALVEVRFLSDREAMLLFAAPEGSYADREGTIEPYFTRLYQAELVALRAWLERNYEDITMEAPVLATALEDDNDSRDIPF